MGSVPARVALVAALLTLIWGCSSGSLLDGVSKDPTYGYTEANPIKVGGAHEDTGPANERRFLEALRGPRGQKISYERMGSCCPFDTVEGDFGKRLLDVYEVTYSGMQTPVRLYVNMYDRGQLLAPKGFSY